MTKQNYLLLVLLCYGLWSCQQASQTTDQDDDSTTTDSLKLKLADPDATPKTQALFLNLQQIRQNKVLFGQQDPTLRGYGWRYPDGNGRCDIEEVCGAYPALYGWDFAWLNHKDSILMAELQRAANQGVVQTISWHMRNPVTGKSCRDTIRTVEQIIPGAAHHEAYVAVLDQAADFLLKAKDKNGELIPFIFRPFHEHTGRWFWWGQQHCSREDFITLWRFTVEYLRDERQVHNLLYAYSPDTVGTTEQYLDRYPGDDYVDVMGIDIYRDVEANDPVKYHKRIKMVVELAEAHGKIPALTETGYSDHTVKNWWTEFLLNPMKQDPVERRLAYMMLWSNYRKDAYFSIYPGHFNADDFRAFYRDTFTVFQDSLPDMYH